MAAARRPPLELPDPPIATDTYVLRPWTGSDVDALVTAWNEPNIAAATAVPDPADTETARRWIAGETERRDRGLALDLVIADPHRLERVLGEAGVVVTDAERGWAELGWWLLPGARGRGIASRAVARFATHLLDTTDLQRIYARIPATNTASPGVARRAGLVRAGRTANDTDVWVRDRTPRTPSRAPC